MPRVERDGKRTGRNVQSLEKETIHEEQKGQKVIDNEGNDSFVIFVVVRCL